MALPHRRGFALVALGTKVADGSSPPGATWRESTVLSDYQTVTPINQPSQPSFYSYQSYFEDYPSELVVKIRPGPTDNKCWGSYDFNIVRFSAELTTKYTYPDNIVAAYDPTYPEPNEPPPDPNGTTALDEENYPLEELFAYPRWVDEDAYDFSSSGVPYDYWSALGASTIVPKINFDYGRSFLHASTPPLASSWKFKVTNLLSIVRNEENGYDEYYPFQCAESIFEGQGYIKFQNPGWPSGCWNTGTVIRGKIAFSSIDVTCTALPELGQTEYGFGGFTAITGSSFSPHSEVDWELTIEDGSIPTPPIDIPQEDNMIVFVNDFWVTEVIPPGG